MGFPVCCSELVFPRFLVWFIFLLSALRRAITWCFAAVGLGDLVDADAVILAGGVNGAGYGSSLPVPESNNYYYHHHPHGPRALPASLVLRKIPAVPYARRPEEEGHEHGDLESCPVCLYEFECGEEVRRLGLCRHVFHRCCIDPWVQIGRRTCPLCRTPIVDEDGDGDAAAADDTDTASSSGSYYPYDAYHDLMDAYYGGGGDEGDYAGLLPPLLDDDPTEPQSLEFISWPLPGTRSLYVASS